MIQPTPVRDQFTICTEDCKGACCRYITVPVPTPIGHDDWDQMRWWLAHEGISVSKDEEGWTLQVMARCRNLRPDSACTIYPHHMETCKEYEAETCEFTGPIDQEFELKSEADLADYLERRKLKRGRKVLAAIRAAQRQRPANADRNLVQMQLLSPLVLCALAVMLCACSTRRVMRFDTNPSGAHIWIDGQKQEKRTPVEIQFTHARRFDVRVEKEGRQSVAKEVEVEEGIEGWPVVDLFFEFFTRERRYAEVIDLPPTDPDPTEADVRARVARAEAFRERTYREAGEARPPERILPPSEILP